MKNKRFRNSTNYDHMSEVNGTARLKRLNFMYFGLTFITVGLVSGMAGSNGGIPFNVALVMGIVLLGILIGMKYRFFERFGTVAVVSQEIRMEIPIG